MGKQPEVSVIIPVYNSFDYIIRCMGSLLCQSFRDYEIVLVDDGSSDGSEILCDEYASKCPFVKTIHQDNCGSSAARNKGLAMAKGDIIVFVDSDDCVHSRYLEILSGIIHQYDADIAMCGMRRFKDSVELDLFSGSLQNSVIEYSSSEIMDVFMRVKTNKCIHYSCGRAFRRGVLEDAHFPVGISNGEDAEAFFKALLKSTKVVETNSELYYYFKNNESVTGGLFDKRYFELFTVWDNIVSIAEQQDPKLVDIARYNRARTDFTVLCDMLLHGDCSTDSLFSGERKHLTKRLRENYLHLIQGPMTIDRKVLLTGVAFGYNPLRLLLRMINGATRKTRNAEIA